VSAVYVSTHVCHEFMQTAWNQGMLQSSDLATVGENMMAGNSTPPQFDDVE